MLKLVAYGLASLAMIAFSGGALAGGPVATAYYQKGFDFFDNRDFGFFDFDNKGRNGKDDKHDGRGHGKKDDCPPREDDKAKSPACKKGHARFCRDDDEVGFCRKDDDHHGHKFSGHHFWGGGFWSFGDKGNRDRDFW